MRVFFTTSSSFINISLILCFLYCATLYKKFDLAFCYKLNIKNFRIFFVLLIQFLILPLLFISQTMTMAPKLASLRERSLPNPPPPPVTRAISPSMLFILYFWGINDLIMPSSIAIIDNTRKPITSPIECKYVIIML